MSNLYEILDEYRHIEQALYDSGGEETPEIAERMAINRDDYDEKMESYSKLRANLKGEVDAIQAEIERLTAMKESKAKVIDRLEDYMLQALLVMGTQDKKGIYRHETPLFKISTARSSSVNIKDVDAIPQEYWVTPPPPDPYIGKKLIADAIKAGQEVAGAEIISNFHLRIR